MRLSFSSSVFPSLITNKLRFGQIIEINAPSYAEMQDKLLRAVPEIEHQTVMTDYGTGGPTQKVPALDYLAFGGDLKVTYQGKPATVTTGDGQNGASATIDVA